MIIIVGASLSEACGARHAVRSKRPACASEPTAMGIVLALQCVNSAAHSVELKESVAGSFVRRTA